MKKLFTLFLALVASVGMMKATVYNGTCGTNLKWSLNTEDSTLVITGSGAMTSWAASSYVPWYGYTSCIAYVSLPTGLTDMSSTMFFFELSKVKEISVDSENANFSSEEGILFNKEKTRLLRYPPKKQGAYTIPNSVTAIAENAFYGCRLTSIIIHDKVTSIGNYAFNSCAIEQGVYISDLSAWCNILFGIQTGSCPLYNAHKLYLNDEEITNLIIPEDVTSIGDCAFEGCTNITSITIPNSVTSIGVRAFSGCYNLTQVHITDIAAWCNIKFGSNPLSTAQHLFLNETEITDIVVPDGVTSIGHSTFYGWKGMTSVTFPESLTNIGGSAFYGCTGLTSITLPDNLTSIGDNAFSGCTGLTSITLPESLTSIGDNAFSGCTNISGELTIPNSVNSIGTSAFYGCNFSKVTINSNAWLSATHTVNTKNNFWKVFGGQELEVVIGDNVKSIGAYIFWASKIHKVTIPNSVKNIGKSAFATCPNLISITIPDSITSISVSAFDNCTKLESAHMGKSVTSIGQYAFRYTSNSLKYIEMTNPTPPDSINVYQCSLTQSSTELRVPAEYLEAYKNAPYWRNFKYINAIDGAEHTVIFYDWNGNELSRVQVPDGGSAVDLAPTPPAVEHQVFIGWSQGLTNVTQSMTVYAQYEPVKVFVQFVDWDGTVLKSDSVYYQGWVEAPDNPYRRRYYFTGWDKTFTWEDLVTDLVITAQYEALPEGSSFVREDGGIHALFSVGEDKQVLFSRGNLQFNAAKGSHACADGTTQAGTWRFAPEQYNVRTWENYNRGSEYDNWIDLFAFGATGYNGNLPTMDETTVSREMDGERSYYDFGLYNAISNGGNNPGEWRMFTQNEWRYLIQQRPHANKLHAHAKIPREYDYIYGVIVLPDDGDTTLIYKEIDYNDPEAYLNYDPSVPTYTLAEWRQLEAKGALFFPAGGLGLVNNGYFNVNAIENGYYLVSFTPPSNYTNLLAIGFDTTTIWSGLNTNPECISVRLVKDAPISHLNAVANNSSYGSISGETIYFGEDITITATPNEGYHFVQWSDGITDNPRTFTLTGDSIITAEFAPNTYTLNVSCDEEQGTIEGESGSFDYLSEHVLTANAHYGYTFDKWSDGVTENPRTLLLTHDTTITAIFNINHYPIMFLNWNGERLSSQSVAYNHAAEAPQLPEREGYIFMGWTADIEHIIDTTFAIALYDKVGVEVTYKAEDGETIFSEHADLHLPAAPIIAGKSFKGWLTESADSENGIVLRATYTFDNPTTHDDVTITPSSNSAYVIFPFITGALTYQLVIRDLFGNVVCKIMFSATGHLLGIAFAPSRNRESQQATQTTGFNFTVEGLDANTTYEYEFVANDDTDEVIETLSGSFTTTAEVPTDNEQVNSPSAVRKYLEDGHLMINANAHIFDSQGKMVR